MTFIVIAFTIKTLNSISAKRRENHTPAPPVSWPPPTEDPILVAPLESQGSFWSWSLQVECYREFIFIHYTYVTFYACSFPHHNIHTHIKYIFRVSISTCKCPHDSVIIYIYIYIYIYSSESLTVTVLDINCTVLNLNCYCLICYCLRPRLLLS